MAPSSAAPRPALESVNRAAAALPKLNEDLAAARSRVSELESEVLSLKADRATLSQQRQQELTAGEETCRTRIADTQRSLESAQVEVKAAQQRATLYEAENENLRKAQVSAPKAVTAARASGYHIRGRTRRTFPPPRYVLKSLMRRYREIDNEYRALLRDPQAAHRTMRRCFVCRRHFLRPKTICARSIRWLRKRCLSKSGMKNIRVVPCR